MEGVGVMKDKELEEIEASHTRCSGGRSCPGEREVERVHMVLCCRQIHCSHTVAQDQTRGLTLGCARNQRTCVHVRERSVGMCIMYTN